MMKLAPIAALLVAAAGATAQDCDKACTDTKTQTVAQTEKTCCMSQKGEAVVQTVAQESKECTATCTEGATQTVAMDGKGECTPTCTDKAGVALASFKTSIPAMAYVVGEKTTSCPIEAKQIADEAHATIGYQVAGVSYSDQMEASRAYAAELNGFLDTMTRVSFVVDGECVDCPFSACEMSEKSGKPMQYRVGPAVFDSAEEAVKAAAVAYGAARQVSMGYKVNGEPTTCTETVAKAKTCSETELTYLVAGHESKCDVEASCLLAKARIDAALAAIEQMSADQG